MHIQSRRTKYACTILIVLILWMLYLSSSVPLDFYFPFNYACTSMSRSRHALNVLSNAKWIQFQPAFLQPWGRLDLPGFRSKDGFAWKRMEEWGKMCVTYGTKASVDYILYGRKLSRLVDLRESEWVNATGVLSGEWVRYTSDANVKETFGGHPNLRKIAPGVDWAFTNPEDWTMNVKGNEGKVMLIFDEKRGFEIEVEEEKDIVEYEDELGQYIKPGISKPMTLAREISATLKIQDQGTSHGEWEMNVHGVHWPRIGVLLLTTTSEKFAGIFGLPYVGLRRDYFVTSQKLLNTTIEKSLDELEKAGASKNASDLWTANRDANADPARPVPHCEYIVYVHLHPVENAFADRESNVQETVSSTVEKQKCSTGSKEVQRMSAVIFSPDCGFILEPKGPPGFVPPSRQHLLCEQHEKF